jgi:C4-dicarboxylate-specific signal transduction histidine kinase
MPDYVGSRALAPRSRVREQPSNALSTMVIAPVQVIASVRTMFGKDHGEKTTLDLNELIRKVLTVVHAEMESQRISRQIKLSSRHSQVVGGRVPLQQVFLNLIMNAIGAMAVVTDRPRLLSVICECHDTQHLLIKVQDSGTGIDANDAGRIFDAFFTTKPNGMGLGRTTGACGRRPQCHTGRSSTWCSQGPTPRTDRECASRPAIGQRPSCRRG